MTIQIKHRESFGYGGAEFPQFYLHVTRSSNGAYGSVDAATAPTLLQYGRGTGADQGWACVKGGLAVRMSSLGLAQAASGFGLLTAFNQGGHVGDGIIAEFWDDDGLGDGSYGSGTALLHLSIETLGDGRLCAKNGTGTGGGGAGTIIGTSSVVIPPGSFEQGGSHTHIEIIPVIHPTAGSVQVWVNNTIALNLTNVNTRHTLVGSGKVGYIQLSGRGAHNAQLMSDWIITNGAGQLRDKRVHMSIAIAAGTYTAGTPSSGTALSCVDDAAENADTDYLAFDNTGLPKAASFTCKPLPSNTTAVVDVSPIVILKKDDGSTCTHRTGLISGATEVVSADIATPTAYTRATLTAAAQSYPTDPNTGVAWAVDDCDNAEVLIRRTA